jgi:hypothetical protein
MLNKGVFFAPTLPKMTQSITHPTNIQSLKRNKQKLLAVASGQNVSWDGGGSGFNDPGPKPKYSRLCPGIQLLSIEIVIFPTIRSII